MKNRHLPQMVGVTGHRDLRPEDWPRLRSIVGKIFADLKAACPGRPIILLSSLAEGADRLVAHVALEYGAELVVPLPMPEEDYRNDFETTESQNEFTELLQKAKKVFVSPDPPAAESAASGQKESRSSSYARVGFYIVKHAHLLIALWDGDPAEKTGGTSQVVRLKREKLPDGYQPGEAIFHVVTPRQSNPNPSGAFELRKIYVTATGV